MLPLWIIDLTDKTSRRDHFVDLLGKIRHVYMGDRGTDLSDPADPADLSDPADQSDQSTRSPGHPAASPPCAEDNDITLKEKNDRRDRREAEKRTTVVGNYWYYSRPTFRSIRNLDRFPEMFESHETEDQSDEVCDLSAEADERTAKALYEFQEEIVALGKDFIETLRKSNCKAYIKINIVVLGDVTQKFTRLLFASIASMLQKEKGRFLPHHIHQGMEIIGMLYLPCDINTMDISDRVRIQRTLREIEVQRAANSARGYDHMMLYQNVQNRTESSYPVLDDKMQAEYLLQCIINLYFACDSMHPLISGTGADDNFYFTMGAASIFFDMAIEDENDCRMVASTLMTSFKEKGDKEKDVDPSLRILDEEKISSKAFINVAKELETIDLYADKMRQPSPHPVRDALADTLKRLYYNSYLRNFPRNFMRHITDNIDESTREALRKVARARKNAYKEVAQTIKESIRRILGKVTPDIGAVAYIEEELKRAQERLSREKSHVKGRLEEHFWDNLQEKNVPKELRTAFSEYHSEYIQDLETHNDSHGTEDLKQIAFKNLAGHIGKESTMTAMVVRCVMAGIIFALAAVPVLNQLSPDVIDLGRVKRHMGLWYPLMFLVPTVIQIIMYYLYRRKKKMYIRVLKAYFLHDAYARVANRVENEATHFYDGLISLCGKFIDRCKAIRRDVRIDDTESVTEPDLPFTMFNINLIGGTFGGNVLIPEDSVERARIRVGGIPYYVNDLERNQYYVLINTLNNDLATLFADIDTSDNRNMVLDEETGQYTYRSNKDIEEEDQMKWKKNIEAFKLKLVESVRKEMLPRENATVSDNLIRCYRHKGQGNDPRFIEPLIDYTATNGELTSEADFERADVKTNRRVDMIFGSYLPYYDTFYQIDPYATVYGKFLFLTRWRSFEKFSLNRVLPREDFDSEIRKIRVIEDEAESDNRIPVSSALLWALLPDDELSPEWFRLFDTDYVRASQCKENLKRQLNVND